MKKLAKVLQTEISGDLATLAKMIQSKGRGKDTILAHITPEEAQQLYDQGGRGSVNPDTGLLEFAPADYALEEVLVTADRPEYGGTPGTGYGGGAASIVASQAKKKKPAPRQEQVGTTGGTAEIPDVVAPTVAPAVAAAPMTPVSPVRAGAVPAVSVPGGTTPSSMPTQPGLTQSPVEALEEVVPTARTGTKGVEVPQTFSEKVKGLPGQLFEGLGGLGGLGQLAFLNYLARQGRGAGEEAAAQSKEAAEKTTKIAQPYQIYGQQLMGQAARGELSPQSLRSYEAAQARLAQAAEERGGVGVMQSAAQLEDLRQSLLNTQATYGLQIAQYGDQIAQNAIKIGLQGDQYANQAASDFYSNLMYGMGNIYDNRRYTPQG